MSGYLLLYYILAITVYHSATSDRQPPAKTPIFSPHPVPTFSPLPLKAHCGSKPQGQEGHVTASFPSPNTHQLSSFSCCHTMPSVLSPNNPVSRSYAPLADETNPSIATSAPTKTVPHNGSVIYGQPSFPPMVAASSSVRLNDLQKAGMSMRNDSEETLSPSASRKGKERAKTLTFDEGALGEVKRASYTGKERVRDIEEGRIYSEEQLASENSRYPPTNEAEEEERRIQEVNESHMEEYKK